MIVPQPWGRRHWCSWLKNPWAIANVSFQLSFAAVAGLTLFAMPIQQRLECRLPRFIAAALAATLSATLFTLPLTLFYFSLLSLVAPLSNLLCLWAVTGALCLGLFAAVLPPLGPILAIPAAWLSRYVLTRGRAPRPLPLRRGLRL